MEPSTNRIGCSPRIGTSPRSWLLTAAVIALAWCALVYPPKPILRLMADSEQYRAMASSILNGDLFHQVDTSTISHLAMVMRPPLFPLLLAVSGLIPVEPSIALVSLHLFLAIPILILAPITLRKLYPPPLTALACGISLYSAKQVLWGDMSEWLAMSCIFSSTLALLVWSNTKRPLSAFLTSLFVTLAILTRSAFIPWLIIPAAIVFFTPRGSRRGALLVITLGLVPLGIWGALQLHRVQSFSLGAYEGLNLVATARTLGPLPVTAHDSNEKRLVIQRINDRGITSIDMEHSPSKVHEWDGEFYDAFHQNFDEVCASIQNAPPGTTIAAPLLAARGFWEHAGRYGIFLRGGIETFISNYAMLPLSCLAVATWLLIRSPRDHPLATATITICTVTGIYLASIFSSILWLYRYFIPVQPGLIFLELVSLFALLRSFFGKAR